MVVSIREIDIVANFMLLDMIDFDVILGMDWLASSHATLDCHDKVIKFSIPAEPTFVFQGDQSEVPCNIISMMCARRLLLKGYREVLEFIRDIEKEKVS